MLSQSAACHEASPIVVSSKKDCSRLRDVDSQDWNPRFGKDVRNHRCDPLVDLEFDHKIDTLLGKHPRVCHSRFFGVCVVGDYELNAMQLGRLLETPKDVT